MGGRKNKAQIISYFIRFKKQLLLNPDIKHEDADLINRITENVKPTFPKWTS